MTVPLVLLVILLAKNIHCDYSCLCSYQVELEIFDKPDPASNVDGYMYEFDCKPSYPVAGLDKAYRAIGNEGKIGYVQYSSNIQIQTCQGSIPDIDRVKTTMGVTSTTTQATATTTVTAATTTTPIVTTTMPSTIMTTVPTSTTTVLLTTLTTTTQPPPTTTKMTTPSTTTTTPIPTTRATTLPKPANSCPAAVNQRSNSQNIFQHGNICYEYVALQKAWIEAQIYCNNSGGHLVSIESQDQQNFVSSMLSQLSVTDPVWLGLNDRVNEEQWELDTGVPAVYTNWEPGRFIDQYHDEEDCGLMIPFHKHRWDDVNCNGITYGGYISHSWICQYK